MYVRVDDHWQHWLRQARGFWSSDPCDQARAAHHQAAGVRGGVSTLEVIYTWPSLQVRPLDTPKS